MRAAALRPRRRSDSGAAAVEFALIFALVLVPTLMGMLQYGWYFYSTQVTSSSARETARRLSVGDCQDSGAATQFARQHSGFTDLTLSYGSPTSPSSNSLPAVGTVLRVSARMDGNIIGFLPLPNDGQITRTVDARVEDTTEDTSCP